MKFRRLRHLWPRKKRRLPLRLRLALWSGGLLLVLNFALLLIINTDAISTFPRIIRSNDPVAARRGFDGRLSHTAPTPSLPPQLIDLFGRPASPLERALLLEVRTISLFGLVLVAITGGAGAYWAAGIILRPVRMVSKAAQRISASTLSTRLALDGPRDETKELADAFDTMLGRLERTFEQQSRFVADVAHELRTPLASLRTTLEVVPADTETTLDDYRAMVLTQERALSRLERLVADLLILATSEQPFSRSEVTLGSLVEEVFTDLKHAADARQVTLRLMNEEEVVACGDEALLTRAFSNLVGCCEDRRYRRRYCPGTAGPHI
jgi:signal transduction histidine kinase